LLAALLLAATGCEQIPPRPPPQHEAKPELPPWYPEPPWNGKERPKRVFFTGKVLFDTNKSVIRADAEPVLQKLLAYLKENEDISRVRIEGHCGLVDHGLDHNRLLAVGFGELRPIAPNDTAAGMQENRRGAFHVAEVGGFPHRGEDPTNGGLVLVILSKEEREALAKKGEVPKPPPPPPFHPEGPIFKPEEPPKAPQSESTAPQADPGAGES
jgi:hypothetical protein